MEIIITVIVIVLLILCVAMNPWILLVAIILGVVALVYHLASNASEKNAYKQQRKELREQTIQFLSQPMPSVEYKLRQPYPLDKLYGKKLALTRAFNEYLSSENVILEIEQYNKYVKQYNQEMLERVKLLKQLNLEFKLDENEDVPTIRRVPKKSALAREQKEWLPKHFLELDEMFSKGSAWQAFTTALDYCNGKSYSQKMGFTDKPDEHSSFWENCHLRCLSLEDGTDLILTPTYVIIYRAENGYQIFQYSTVKLGIRKVTNYNRGHLISHHYLHETKTGAPDQRYKDNPLICTYELHYVSFTFGGKTIELECYDAEKLIKEWNDYSDDISTCGGVEGEVYKCAVCSNTCESVSGIVAEYEKKQQQRETARQAEERRKEEQRLAEAKRREELARQAEEKRKKEEAAHRAAEEKRRAELEHQAEEHRRQEEERRRQEEEHRRQEEETRRAAEQRELERQEQERAERRRQLVEQQKLRNAEKRWEDEGTFAAPAAFADTTVDEMTRPQEQKNLLDNITEQSVRRFVVEGTTIISNNVFKIKLRQEANIDLMSIRAYFAMDDETLISNVRTIQVKFVGEVTEVGFVLVSHIDFTKIKKCYLHIESEKESLGKIEFTINISFYSDF